MDIFAQILFDLGKEIETELYPDANRLCQLNYQNELTIQLQYDEPKERISIASFLCDVPPGKYREKLFQHTLAFNHQFPQKEIFAYSDQNNQLTLFIYVSIHGLRSDALFAILQRFIQTALEWKNAIENGKTLPISLKKKGKGSMFGLKP